METEKDREKLGWEERSEESGSRICTGVCPYIFSAVRLRLRYFATSEEETIITPSANVIPCFHQSDDSNQMIHNG